MMNAAQSGFALSRRRNAPDAGPAAPPPFDRKDGCSVCRTTLEKFIFPAAKNHPKTRLVHEGTLRSEFGETSETLYLTQGFTYESAESAEARFLNEEPGYSYSRFSNPTVTMFEERMASLEGAEAACATASGMAAVTAAMMGQVQAGDHVVAARALFGSCRWIVEDLLPRFGVGCTLVDGPDLAAWRRAVRPETKAFLRESPANPTLEVIGLLADALHDHPKLARLTYPGRPDHPQADLVARQMLGPSTMVALDLRGGKE